MNCKPITPGDVFFLCLKTEKHKLNNAELIIRGKATLNLNYVSYSNKDYYFCHQKCGFYFILLILASEPAYTVSYLLSHAKY